MPTIVHDRSLTEEILRERQALGNRTRDEVWEGVTHIMPEPDNEHLRIATFFSTVFSMLFGLDPANSVQSTANISDRIKGWKKNYRNPDMVYYSAGSRAEDHGTFWYGGPDFLLEIVSPDDMSRDKLPFYATIGTKEVLILDREPWQFELHQLSRGRTSTYGDSPSRGPNRLAKWNGPAPIHFAPRPPATEGSNHPHRDGPRVDVLTRMGLANWVANIKAHKRGEGTRVVPGGTRNRPALVPCLVGVNWYCANLFCDPGLATVSRGEKRARPVPKLEKISDLAVQKLENRCEMRTLAVPSYCRSTTCLNNRRWGVSQQSVCRVLRH